MRLRANCKINLGLDVLRRRKDGFHDLSTVMYPVRELYDEITLERKNDSFEIDLFTIGAQLDCPTQDNLCLRSARLMQQRYGIERVGGLTITLDKRIPFGAGLGGGSSDATAVILGINELFELNLSEAELIEIAAELGSDTPFFVRNTPQLCTGRGEVMEPFPISLDGLYIVLIKPEGVHISTREAFSTIKPAIHETSLQHRLMSRMEEWQATIKNDFEESVFQSHPVLAEIKQGLIDAGAVYAAMSGSGSTIFGLFNSRPKIKGELLQNNSPLIFQL